MAEHVEAHVADASARAAFQCVYWRVRRQALRRVASQAHSPLCPHYSSFPLSSVWVRPVQLIKCGLPS